MRAIHDRGRIGYNDMKREEVITRQTPHLPHHRQPHELTPAKKTNQNHRTRKKYI